MSKYLTSSSPRYHAKSEKSAEIFVITTLKNCEIAPPETLLELYITITNGSVNFYSMNNNGFIMFAVIFHLQLYFQFYSYKWCYYSILFSITAIPVSIPVLWFGHVLV